MFWPSQKTIKLQTHDEWDLVQGEVVVPVFKNNKVRPGAVAQACNPSTLGGRGGRITWAQEFKTSLANMMKPSLLIMQKLVGRVVHTCNSSYLGGWGTRIAEPRKQRFQWAKITLLHPSLGNRGRPCLNQSVHTYQSVTSPFILSAQRLFSPNPCCQSPTHL